MVVRPHPRLSSRNRAAADDLLIIQRATALILDLGNDLDRQLPLESRESERMRLLREATNRITRAANDAIHAYRKAIRSTEAQIERNAPGDELASEMRARLQAARDELRDALDAASHRYPWAGQVPASDPDPAADA
jgi:hypothetical protein